MQLFYTPDITSTIYTLDEQESKHCIKVLRKLDGDILHLTDGIGNLFKAEITDASPKACKLKIIETQKEFEKRNYWLHIAIAPTKNIERFEWFLEKATEIGIDEITPLVTEHSERQQIKAERLERIVIAAMKQSIKAYKPQINPLCNFKQFLQKEINPLGCFIAHCFDSEKQELKNIDKVNSTVTILVGPEGDFSLEEVKLAVEKKFVPISLGRSRLRTETAGVVACHTINLLNQ
jgi:16S rRNA (uracil1498-N3)-methyltransferase